MNLFPIKQDAPAAVVQAEPIVGKWYCAFQVYLDQDGEEVARDDALAKYIGDGVFVDEEGAEVDMTGGDYLVQQY